jgi:hypothetical protein
MSPNPPDFIEHLRKEGYHSRSNKHSNALALAIVSDLIANCPLIRDRAARGELVYQLNFTLRAGRADWNVDLVFGSPGIGAPVPPEEGLITCAMPSTVQIAVEIKSIMTEHRKAVKNRKRDLEAHHEHVHEYDSRALAGGVFVINGSDTFASPLRPAPTEHRNPRMLVEHCVSELRSVAFRTSPSGRGLDAKAVIVVDMDNVDLSGSRYVTRPPAPALGDPLHYDAFIRTLCERYTRSS